ncbi:MAG: TerC family protein [Candidatus Acidiferrales bacterium]
MTTSWQMWAIFGGVTFILLVLDLGVFHRKARIIGITEALISSAVWILASLAFNLWIYFAKGPQAGVEFLTGYLVEKSLSVDNILIFLLIFRAFRVPSEAHHKVLFCGVLGALVLRAIFVAGGVALLSRFHRVIYVFGAILLLTGIRMLSAEDRVVSPEKNWLVRLARRWLPITRGYVGDLFVARQNGSWMATPLLLALLTVEATDILFAVDSVPAVLAITQDPFIVYSSNVFAILGLRALYFALADLLPRIHYLHQGLAAILAFVGLKMLLADAYPISAVFSLAVITGILAVTILVSSLRAKSHRTRSAG